MSLVKNVLEKLQFRYNQSQLEELDDETLDYDVSFIAGNHNQYITGTTLYRINSKFAICIK